MCCRLGSVCYLRHSRPRLWAADVAKTTLAIEKVVLTERRRNKTGPVESKRSTNIIVITSVHRLALEAEQHRPAHLGHAADCVEGMERS